MFRTRWLQALHSLGLEFWLPLPLLGLFFWVAGGMVTEQILTRSYNPNIQLQTNMHLQAQPPQTVLLIKVVIKKAQGFSEVKVKTANSALKELQFEFPMTDFNQVEAAIAKELGLPPHRVRSMMHFKIEDIN